MARRRRGESRSAYAAWLLATLAMMCLPSADARIAQEQTQVAVRVTDIQGKTVERKIIVGVFYDDNAPRPHPVLVLNHGQNHLLQLFSDYGKTARLPTLWIYSANDQLWGPTLPRTWFNAFRAAGAGEFAPFPPVGEDGHLLFSRAPQLWQPRVLEFLRPLGYRPLHTAPRRNI